jgi:hypothetical protein
VGHITWTEPKLKCYARAGPFHFRVDYLDARTGLCILIALLQELRASRTHRSSCHQQSPRNWFCGRPRGALAAVDTLPWSTWLGLQQSSAAPQIAFSSFLFPFSFPFSRPCLSSRTGDLVKAGQHRGGSWSVTPRGGQAPLGDAGMRLANRDGVAAG